MCALRERGQPNIRTMVWFKICSTVCMGGYSHLLCSFRGSSMNSYQLLYYNFFINNKILICPYPQYVNTTDKRGTNGCRQGDIFAEINQLPNAAIQLKRAMRNILCIN